MAAFFRNTKQSGFDLNRREGDLSVVVPQSPKDRARWAALPAEIESAKKAQDTLLPEADAAFTNWVANASPTNTALSFDGAPEQLRLPLTEPAGTNFAARVRGQTASLASAGSFERRDYGPIGRAPVWSTNVHFSLGDLGGFDSTDPFSTGAWVRVPEDFKGEGSLLARMAGEDRKGRGWDLFIRDDYFGVHMIRTWPSVALKVRAQDKAVRRGEWHHLFMTYDGSSRAEGVKLFLGGLELPVNRERNGLEGSMRVALPLRLGRGEVKNELAGVAVQDVRIYSRKLDPSEVGAIAAAPRLAELLPNVEFARTNNPAREVVRQYFRATQHAGWRDSTARLLAVEAERQAIRGRSPWRTSNAKSRIPSRWRTFFPRQYDKPRTRSAPRRRPRCIRCPRARRGTGSAWRIGWCRRKIH